MTALPRLRDGECQVWWAGVQEGRRPGLVDLLDEVELSRLAAYRRADDRARFVLGCVIVRRLLGAHLSTDPAAVVLDRSCPGCDRPHGKVRLQGGIDPVQVSVSHSGEHVVVAAHPDAAVGVDVEWINPGLDTRQLAGAVLSSGEQQRLDTVPTAGRAAAFTTYWTRKEAVVKATGEGLRTDLASVEVSAPDQPPEVLAGPHGVQLFDLPAEAGYRAALAVVGDRPVRIRNLAAAALLRPG